MRLVLALLIFMFVTLPAAATDGAWRFWKTQEDWGPMCFAGVKAGPLYVGFHAAPDGPINGFVQGAALPGTTTMQWQVTGYPYRQYVGGADDYFGGFTVSGVQQSFLDEVVAGAVLLLTTVDGRPDNASLPLRGSAVAITEFRSCHGSQPTPAPSQSISTLPTIPVTTGRPAPQPTSRAQVVSMDQAIDQLTTYTTVIGRGLGCNIDTQVPQQRVFAWLERTFSANKDMAVEIYIMGLAVATGQQRAGTTPNSCESLAQTINTFPWPS